AGEVIQRMGRNVWRSEDTTAAATISRMHSALEGLEHVLTRDGCGKLADAFAESSGWPGIMIKRTRDEQADAAELFLAPAIPHYKESVWIFGSFEVLQDTQLGSQVPALIADAKDRLEVVAFTTGTGSGQPFGIITHGTSDATTCVLTAAMVYGLHQSLPPR